MMGEALFHSHWLLDLMGRPPCADNMDEYIGKVKLYVKSVLSRLPAKGEEPWSDFLGSTLILTFQMTLVYK